jgi:LCP family protein required for cell wall assembly
VRSWGCFAQQVEGATEVSHPRGAAAVLVVAFALFVGGGLYSGWLFLTNLREILAARPDGERTVTILDTVTVRLPDIKEAAKPAAPTPHPAQVAPGTPTPVAPTPIPAEEELPIWDGKDRVTILLLGIDQREDQQELPTRSDTMMLLTLDPLNQTAGLLSIPRDLWVPIPGYQPNKINVAHFLGEDERPDFGPELARRTVQGNFGVHVHYVARVDFRGFEQLIDAIDGVTIDVDRAIIDNEYPNEKYGITRLYIPVGPQRMSGMQALRYARSRHADSDFGRVRRQQRVLQAAREQVLQMGVVPRLPQMFGIVRGSIWTDIPWIDMLKLARVGSRIKSEAITMRQIDDTLVEDTYRDGSVLVPLREKIRPVIRELFYDPALRKDAARIEVLNGTNRDGLATATRAALIDLGFDAFRADQAPRASYATTVIVDNGSGKRATLERLRATLKVPPSAVRAGERTSSGADITIILGADFKPI